MMKQKLFGIGALALMTFSALPSYGFGISMPSFSPSTFKPGISVFTPKDHSYLNKMCVMTASAACPDVPYVVTMWFDWGMLAATLLDDAATAMQDGRTIDARDAIKKLKKALEGGSGGGSCGSGGTSGDTTLATVYTTDLIMTQIEVTNVSTEQSFENTRKAIQDYLFETTDTSINEGCGLDDKTCATQRQNEWLLASVTLASATADKVLDMTVKKTSENTTAQQTSEGTTTLTAHFKKLAENFNAQTSPTGLYNRMADIVLDTHRQINDANALLGRDLEVSSLRVINETGPELLTDSETGE